jgi:hypothetical protein
MVNNKVQELLYVILPVLTVLGTNLNIFISLRLLVIIVRCSQKQFWKVLGITNVLTIGLRLFACLMVLMVVNDGWQETRLGT